MSKTAVQVEVVFTPQGQDERALKDKNVVVIDVLRSSTTIAAALQNGAREIIPVRNIETAVKISSSLDAQVVLRGGERGGKMIEGFDLGNSPAEYTESVVRGKSVILLTTNGSPAMANARYARNLFVAGFVNLSVVVSALAELKSDITIICSGKENQFCIEDSVCAGRIVGRLMKEAELDVLLTDASASAVALDKAFGKSVPKMLASCDHGKYLAEIGFGPDLELCGEIDSIPVLPVLTAGVLRLGKQFVAPASPSLLIAK